MNLDALFSIAFSDTDLLPEDLPKIDLYMDQILTLLEDCLGENKRHESDKLITKTMVNNYTKEQLIMPVKGKKYTREQLMQLLCVLNLKQNLALSDIKTLTHVSASDEVDFESAYRRSLLLKEQLRTQLPALLSKLFAEENATDTRESRLALCLALSSGATFLRRICEGMIDQTDSQK